MAAFDALSPEVTYVLKSNIAYPIIGASAAGVASLAQSRINDAYSPSGATVTIPSSAVTVVKQ